MTRAGRPPTSSYQLYQCRDAASALIMREALTLRFWLHNHSEVSKDLNVTRPYCPTCFLYPLIGRAGGEVLPLNLPGVPGARGVGGVVITED
jgi:hypothetical protein